MPDARDVRVSLRPGGPSYVLESANVGLSRLLVSLSVVVVVVVVVVFCVSLCNDGGGVFVWCGVACGGDRRRRVWLFIFLNEQA